MATIINTPGGDNHSSDEGMGVGMIFGIILAFLIVVVLFYMYGWPAIRGEQPQEPGTTTNIYNPPAPSQEPGTTTTTTTF